MTSRPISVTIGIPTRTASAGRETLLEEIDSSQRLKLDVLEDEYRRRHGVAVEWIKAEVGEGETFENGVGRVVLSANGGWFECIDLPMEFSGSVGAPCDRRFISDGELRRLTELLASIATSPEPGGIREFGLLTLYGRAGIFDERSAFVYQRRCGPSGEVKPPIQMGALQSELLPAVVRCRIHTDEDLAGVPVRHGVVVCLSGVGERNLMVLMPHEGGTVRDLGGSNVESTPQ